MKKYVLMLDLKNNPELIQSYIEHHRKVWPEIIESIVQSGILNMEIYQVANRLCMLVEAEDAFSFEQKNAIDATNEKVQAWEALMDEYQQRLPFAQPNQKWVLMDCVFSLMDYTQS